MRSTAPALTVLGGPCLLDDGLPPGGRPRLLGVFAHPDDETFCAGGTFARYAERGADIMVVSATRGQAGEIRDAAAGNRRTIAAVRENELRLACERLGVATVRCLDHIDGTLADARFPALVEEVAEIICEFRPDVVITFGPDGGYGHPDHVTISAVTTAACQRAGSSGHRPPRLYYRHFPPGDLLIMERLAAWLTSQTDRFAGTPAFAQAFLLLAEAAGTMGHIRDHVQVRWYPPGSYVVENGEQAAELFLILSGEADVREKSSNGSRERLGVGEFFGYRHPSADVVAAGSLTCMVLSAAPPARFAGRGPGARLAGTLPGAQEGASAAYANVRASDGVVFCDVFDQVRRKVEALSAHRSQFPLEPDTFPEFLLQEIFGREYFMASSAGRLAHLEDTPLGPVLEPHLSASLPAQSQPADNRPRIVMVPHSTTTRTPARRHATRRP